MCIYVCIFASGACTRPLCDAGHPSTREAFPLASAAWVLLERCGRGMPVLRCWEALGVGPTLALWEQDEASTGSCRNPAPRVHDVSPKRPPCPCWLTPLSVLQSRSRPTTSHSWGKPQKSEASSLAVASTAPVRETWRDHTSGILTWASYPGQSPASSAVLGLLASSGSSPLPPGMMLGGGCGRELAHWIIHGRPEKDMYGYDIRCVTPPAPAPRGLWAPSSIGGPWGDGFRGRAGCWHWEWVSGSVCAAARVPLRSWNQLGSIALMNLHVEFISFASSHFYANSFHQTGGGCGDGKGQGNYFWVLLLCN